jgi:hypothetical protein
METCQEQPTLRRNAATWSETNAFLGASTILPLHYTPKASSQQAGIGIGSVYMSVEN